MIFMINQILIGWVINLLLFYVNYDSGNPLGTSLSIAALVAAYAYEAYNVGLYGIISTGQVEHPEATKKRKLAQAVLWPAIILLLLGSFIDYYVNA